MSARPRARSWSSTTPIRAPRAPRRSRSSTPMADPRRTRVVVALAMPGVVAADLSVAAQVFGFRDEANRYSFSVCTEHPGLIDTSTGFRLEAPHGLEELGHADTVI